MPLEQLGDAIRAFLLSASRVQFHEPFDALIHDTFQSLQLSLHVVDDATRRVTIDVPGGDVQTLFCEVRVASFAIEGDALAAASMGDCPEGALPEGEFAKHVATLTRALQTIEAWKPFARSLTLPEEPDAASIAEPDGPVSERTWRWRGETIDVPDILQWRLLKCLWDYGETAGSHVPRSHAIQFVYKEKGKPLAGPGNAFKGVKSRTNRTLAASGLLLRVKVPRQRYLCLESVPLKGTPKGTPDSVDVP